MNRRDILKLFGVGASVVPVIGGAPHLAAESKLIETPKVEPIIQPSFDGNRVPFDLLNIRQGEIQASVRANGQTYWFTAHTFFTESSVSTVDVSIFGGPREFLPARYDLGWTLKGKLVGASKDPYTVG